MIKRVCPDQRSAWFRWLVLCILLVAAGTPRVQAQLVSAVNPLNISFAAANSVASDAEGNVYVLETNLGRVTRINVSGTSAVYAGGGAVILDPQDPFFMSRAAEAFKLNLNGAEGMRFGLDGSFYVSDTTRGRIIRISREPRPGFEWAFWLVGRVYAGNGRTGNFAEGDTSFLVSLNRPGDLAFDSVGNLYIADTGNFRVRRITPAGVVTLVAGTGLEGFSGDGGLAIDASIHAPRGLALDSLGNLYISMYDFLGDNSRVRKVTPQGIISTVAGSGPKGFSGDAGPAVSAQLNTPHGLTVDSSNTLYIADSQNNRIRIITPTQKIQTIAGTGERSDNGVGRQAIETAFSNPRSINFTASGSMLVSDVGNFRILRISNVANSPRVSFEAFVPGVLSMIPGGSEQRMEITISRFNFTGNADFTVSGLPSTVSGGALGPGLGNTGTIVLSAVPGATPQTSQVTLHAFALNNLSEAISAVSTNVTIAIVPAPTLAVSPASLSFSATSGGSNPATQTITVSDAAFGFLSWAALATTSNGGNWLNISPTSGTQNTALVVAANVGNLAPGTYSGNVQVSSPGAIGTPKEIPITFTLAPPLPLITSGGVVNNASYNRASLSLAPGSIAAIFGANLTANGATCLPPACGPTFGANGRLGTTMAGAQVTVNGTTVPLFYASPTQLGVQIPSELGPGQASVQVNVGGRLSNGQGVNVEIAAPGIFTTTSNGIGAGAITHANGSLVTAANPAQRDEILTLYATGLGGTTPAVPTGAVPTEASTAALDVSLAVDGIFVQPEFAGLAGCCVGLNQINFLVPDTVRTGISVSVVVNAGGRLSNPVTLQMR